ncbi:MAG TPA: thiamine pyrophosphate-binding protein, partial [Bryobacteraceae bacterium]|nr:thiamine pyrophosphate-binding protein [Bryobacteraceae bacterium]
GPVLLDIPMDVQRAGIDPSLYRPEPRADAGTTLEPAQIKNVVDAIRRAKRPLFLVGGGIRAGRVAELARRLVDVSGVPTVCSLMAVDVLPFEHPCRVGMIGSYGNRWANLALSESDVLVVMGSRLDVRQTGSQVVEFKGDRAIFHLDCEPGEINNRVVGCEAVLSELRDTLPQLIAEFQQTPAEPNAHNDWMNRIRELRRRWPDVDELRDIEGVNPNVFMHQLSRGSAYAAAFVVDVGQHQMWAAQSLELGPNQRFLTSGGMGSMGFSLPAAIGTAFAVSPAPVVLVAGDGGFQCNIQELQTVVHHNLPIKMVVINNQCHGMVRQFQESYFDSRFQSTYWGYSAPDFPKVAEGYGIPGQLLADPDDANSAVDWLWSGTGPRLLDVRIDVMANAYPKIAFGKPIAEMEPFAKPLEMEGT